MIKGITWFVLQQIYHFQLFYVPAAVAVAHIVIHVVAVVSFKMPEKDPPVMKNQPLQPNQVSYAPVYPAYPQYAQVQHNRQGYPQQPYRIEQPKKADIFFSRLMYHTL